MMQLAPAGRQLLDTLQEMVREAGGCPEIDIASLGFGRRETAAVAAMQADGRVGRVRLVAGLGTAILRQREGRTGWDDMLGAFGADNVRAALCHTKLVLVRGQRDLALLTSANLNRNNRPEQYERADERSRDLKRFVDAVFKCCPPGLSRSGSLEAMRRVLDANPLDATDYPAPPSGAAVHALCERGPALVLCHRFGMGSLLPVLGRIAGRGSTLDATTWALSKEDAFAVGREAEWGWLSEVNVRVPARLGRRADGAKAHAAMQLAADCFSWSPSHAKVAVLEGPEARFTLTGCNFQLLDELDIMVVRSDAASAIGAREALASIPTEPPPEPPSDAEMAAARKSRLAWQMGKTRSPTW